MNNRDLEIWVIGHRKSLKLVPFESLDAVSYSPSIVTMSLSSIISKIKRDSDRSRDFFHTPLAFDVTIRGSPSEYCHPVWYRKTRMVGLPDGEKSLRICNRLDRIPACDRQTDGQRD